LKYPECTLQTALFEERVTSKAAVYILVRTGDKKPAVKYHQIKPLSLL